MFFAVNTSTLKGVLKGLEPFSKRKSSYFSLPLSEKIALDVREDRVILTAMGGDSTSAEFSLIQGYHKVDVEEGGFIAVDASLLDTAMSVIKTDFINFSFDPNTSTLKISNPSSNEPIVEIAATDANQASAEDLAIKPEFDGESSEIIIEPGVFTKVIDNLNPSSTKNRLWGNGVGILYKKDGFIRFVACENNASYFLTRTVEATTREFEDIMVPVELIKPVTNAIKEAGDGQLHIIHNFEDAEKTTRLTLTNEGYIVLDIVIPQSDGYLGNGTLGKMLAQVPAVMENKEIVSVSLSLAKFLPEVDSAVKIGNIEPDFYATNQQGLENINIHISGEENVVYISTDHKSNRYMGTVEPESVDVDDNFAIQLSHAKLSDIIRMKFLGGVGTLNLNIVKNFRPENPEWAAIAVLPDGVSIGDDDFNDNIGYGVVKVL